MDADRSKPETVKKVFEEKHGLNSNEQLRWDRHVVRRTMKDQLKAEYVRITVSGEEKDVMRLRVVSPLFKDVGLLKRFSMIHDALDIEPWMTNVLARRTLIMDPLTPSEFEQVNERQ